MTTELKPPSAPYVSHDAGALAGAVVLRPGGAVARLVPIAGEPSPIAARAIEQHAILVRTLRDRGMNGLWLIGLWERSIASRTMR